MTATYTTPAEAARTIRDTLKRRYGFTSRDVSVRSSSYSMGSNIDVTIRRDGIREATVRDVAEQAERIRRCDITGEILSGGNRFVSVCYDDTVRNGWRSDYLPALKAAAESHPGDGALIPIGSTDLLLGTTGPSGLYRWTLWGDRCLRPHGASLDELAEAVGYFVLNPPEEFVRPLGVPQ